MEETNKQREEKIKNTKTQKMSVPGSKGGARRDQVRFFKSLVPDSAYTKALALPQEASYILTGRSDSPVDQLVYSFRFV